MPRTNDPHAHGEEVRLQAFLAHSGVASRRAAEELIAAGHVFVNGKSVTAPGTKIRPGVDEIEVQGQPVEVQPVTWVALHKPKGYVTTRIDPYNRKTVYELIPERYHGLFHVGRLDRDSEGLLLLTNDGELANRMLHPSFGVTKEYWADVEGKPTAEEMHRLTEGVEDQGDTMQAESVRRLHQTGENQHRLSVVMREGKKREVRRMLEALGHPVSRLIRRRFGPVALGELKPGKWRVVADSELAALRAGKKPPRSSRLHSESDEAAVSSADAATGGERRPQRKPRPEERPRPPAKGAKAFAAAPRAPRASELRAKAREDAVRGRHDEGKPRRASQERDERPYQERDPRGAPVKRGPVKRVRRDADARPSAPARAPVRRERDDDRGPSPSQASRGFPKGRAKPGAGPRPTEKPAPRARDDGDREMETAYPSTRRGSARPSPRGGAPDERRGSPDAPRAGRSRDGAPSKRGPSKPSHGRGRDDESPARRPSGPSRGRDDAPRPRSRGGDDDAPARRSSAPSRGRDDARGSKSRGEEGDAPVRRPSAPPRGRPARGDDESPARRPSGSARGRDDAPRSRSRSRDDESAPRRPTVPSRGRDDGPRPRGRGRDADATRRSSAPARSRDEAPRPRSRSGDDDEAPKPRGAKGGGARPGGGPKRGPGPKPGGAPKRPGGGPKGRGGPPGRKGGPPRGRS